MKAIAVVPGGPTACISRSSPSRRCLTSPAAAASWCEVLRVGVDGTDKEINAAEYGAAPDGYDFLVIGHEGFGQVEAVGPERHIPPAGRLRRRDRPPARARASTTPSACRT